VLAHGIGAEPHTFVFNDPWGDKNRGYMNYYGKNVSYDWPGYNNGFQSLTEIAWCIATRYTPPEVSDTVVDDSQFGRGFFLNTTLPASMTLWKDMNSGYGGHAWFTYTRSGEPDNGCYAVWMPLLPQGGVFEVSAYIPSFGDASEATYQVSHGGGVATVVISQADHRDSWVSLGTYSFSQGNGGSVRLGDTSSVAGQVIAFDAVRWSYKGITSADYPRTHQIPSEYILYQNYPNPFNPSTVLRYFLPLESTVRLQIVDALGRVVATPVDGKQTPGLHELEWKPSGLSSGFYFVRMRAVGVNGSSAYADTKKILMMR
jgi:hypothetical protein